MVDSHLSRATFRPLPMPQFRQQAKCIRSPFAPLPFDRPQGREQCRDDDLLPSCWFSIDSEDLNRLHYKLQRRISRRRSLNRANCPFGESNPRRAKILEKYQRLRGGIRRALSDHQISFMDPKRDVELEIQQQQRKAEWKSQHDKRVSFSAPSALPTKEEGNSSGSGGGGGGIEWPPLLRQLARNKSSVSLQLELPTSPKCTQPAKPILARKASRQGGSVGHLKPPSPSPLGAASANFRNRTGTIASTGHYTADEYAICPMDYATFRAWRRGSRLSIDVLNNTISVADFELARKSKRNHHGGGGRIGWGSWVGFLKRVLADCLQQRRAISDLACFQQAA